MIGRAELQESTKVCDDALIPDGARGNVQAQIWDDGASAKGGVAPCISDMGGRGRG